MKYFLTKMLFHERKSSKVVGLGVLLHEDALNASKGSFKKKGVKYNISHMLYFSF